MEFDCKTTSILKPIMNSKGVIAPLCNTCAQVDCRNPIRKKTVSVLGKNEEWQVLVIGSAFYQVVQCSGYCE